nr:RHS repeat domain-containing protein [Pseudomonas sp. CC120222-01a]
MDSAGNLTGTDLPDGNHLAFKYDEFCRLIEETDPLGLQIRYQHHLATPLVTETRFPDGSVWHSH